MGENQQMNGQQQQQQMQMQQQMQPPAPNLKEMQKLLNNGQQKLQIFNNMMQKELIKIQNNGGQHV